MYVVVKRQSDLGKLPQLSERRNILVRFKMNGCSWCVSSQPDWDSMVKEVKGQLAPQDAIAEVESEFVDHFRDFIQQTRGEPLPPIKGFPSVIMIKSPGMEVHQGRDKDSYIKSLTKVKSIEKSKPRRVSSASSAPSASRTRKVDPRFKLIEQGKRPRRPSRRPSRRPKRKST